MTNLDKAAVSTIVILTAFTGAVIFWGSHIPITVSCAQPENCREISSRGGMVFEFSRPVDATRLESTWQITPPAAGSWELLDENHAKWISFSPLDESVEIIYGFKAGTMGMEGEELSNPVKWKSKVRSPQLLAMNSEGNGRDLYFLDPEGIELPRQLTNTGGKIFDFDVDPVGDIVVFTAINQEFGSDIWQIDRDGRNQRMLLNCGGDRCTAPVWSPTRREIAYTREKSDPNKNGALGAPRSWMLNPVSGVTSPLFEDSQEIGYGASWNSDGIWLSIWDGMGGGIKIVNRETGKTFLVQSSNGTSGCWTLDKKHLVFANTILRGTGFHNVILKVNVDDQSLETLLGENSESGGISYDNPLCNPVDDRLAVTIQPNINIPGRRLVIFDPEQSKHLYVEDDLSVIPGLYSWDTSGDRLVFQVDRLSSKQGETEIKVWKDGVTSKVATGYRFPKWLP